jgi:prepilin-type N-terminal cleavage/methylation domain-containing protein
MRHCVSAWCMRKGFTLIEVMVSVVIITVVIAAMLQLFSNNSHFFSQFKTKMDLAWSSTLLLYQDKIGFEDDEIALEDLLKKYNIDDEFRRDVKDMKAHIKYQKISTIDTSEIDMNESIEESLAQNDRSLENSDGVVFEIGKTSFKIGDQSNSFLRLKLE